ncbi:MAG: DUF1501 domain-containing protein [Rubellimicrobium sp.]|nr:DUF1501 domain-containing protein [Rubellimicrobium sp.]
MDRRAFLTRSAFMGCSLAASPLLTPIALAAAPWDERLVVIVLRGAMDGIDAIRPAGDPALRRLRPVLAAGAEPDLDGFWGLHPALSSLRPLWDSGEFGAVQAISTPYRDRRSHFDGQDILEAGTTGTSGEARRDGWLNRMIATVPGLTMETAWAIGRERMLILEGGAAVGRWSPDARLALDPAARRLIEMVTHEDPLFRDATLAALGIVDDLARTHEDGAGGQEGGQGGGQGGGAGHLQLARFAAQRLREEARIVSFSLSGWDTHGGQDRALARPLAALAEVILALRDGLGPVWGRTAVLAITEFGRTAQENGTRGTDHGTGGAMLFAGGALRGGRVAGDWPGLGDLYGGRDILPTRDLRAWTGWVMRGLFGLSREVIETAVFPGLDMGGDPAILA